MPVYFGYPHGYAVPRYMRRDRWGRATAASPRARGTVDYGYDRPNVAGSPNVAAEADRGTTHNFYPEYGAEYSESPALGGYGSYRSAFSGLGAYTGLGAEVVKATRSTGAGGTPKPLVASEDQAIVAGLKFNLGGSKPSLARRDHGKPWWKYVNPSLRAAILKKYDALSATDQKQKWDLTSYWKNKTGSLEAAKLIVGATFERFPIAVFEVPSKYSSSGKWIIRASVSSDGQIITYSVSRPREGIASWVVKLPVKIVVGISREVASAINKLMQYACVAAQNPLSQLALTASSGQEAAQAGSQIVSQICGGPPPPVSQTSSSSSLLPILLLGGVGAVALFLL